MSSNVRMLGGALLLVALVAAGLSFDAAAQGFIDPAELAADETGKFSLSLLSGKESYKPKDTMIFMVLTEEACKLTLADVDSTGSGSVLFPNKLQPNNLLEAGRVLVIGDRSSPIRLLAGEAETHTIVAQCVTPAGALVRRTLKIEVE